MQFLFYLAAVVIGSVLAYALAPKAPKQRAPTLEDFALPTAEEGRSIPWIFGTIKVTDPNFIWYGDLEVRTQTKDKVKTRLYRMGTQQEFCISPVDALVALEYGGKDCGIAEVTSSQQISINLPNLFGGRDKEGGIDGDFDVCFGEPTQAVNDYLLAQIGAPLSAFRDSLTLVGRKPSWVANSTYIKPLLPTVRCIEAGWADGACWYPETAAVPDESPTATGYDAFVTSFRGGGGLDYRWLLDSAFAADGDTEASVGTGGALAIKREANESPYTDDPAGDSITGLQPGVTCGTSDNYAVQFGDYSADSQAAMTIPYYVNGTQSLTLGVWVDASPGTNYFVFGTNVDNDAAVYQGFWLKITTDGKLYISFGDAGGLVSAYRKSYISAPGVIVSGERNFFVFRWDTENLGQKWTIFANGQPVVFSYESGDAGTVAWSSGGSSPRIGLGCGYRRNAGENLIGFMDEAFLHLDAMTDEEIADLYHVGTCTGGGGSWDMNPAHIIYKALTNSDQGASEPSATLDDASFRAAALLFYTESLGLSFQWRNEGPIRDFVAEVCRHAGAVMSLDPTTGKTQIVPLRDDYDVNYLDLVTENDVIEVTEWQDAADGEAVNEVTVTYRKRNASNGSATWVNRASVQQAGLSHETMDFVGITKHSLALRVAKRETLQRSSNLSKGKIKVDRTGWDKLPGAVFRFSHAAEGIEELVVRVADIDLGQLTDGAITITVVQDIFSLDDVLTDVLEQDNEWTAPDTAPAAATAQDVLEAPYWQLLGDLGAAETAALAAGAGYVVPLAGKPTGLSVGYNAWSLDALDSLAEYTETVTDQGFSPTATLAIALDRQTDAGIVLSGGVDLDLVEVGWLAMIGTGTAAEICYVGAIDTALNTVALARGRLDTTAQEHASGARVWFLDGNAADWPRIPIGWTDGNAVDVKIQTVTGAGVLDLTAATAISTALDARQVRPYPPGNLEINGEYHPTLLEGALTVTWAHRDRIVQGLMHVSQYDATDYGPEAGTTYSAYAYDDDTSTLLDSATGITGTTWAPSPGASCNLRLEIASVRDGYASWQRQVRVFQYIETQAILTEGSEQLLTEAGETLITET